jgi:hypothetical protein
MDNDEAVSRWQGQKEAAADSRCNNQIETTAAAAAAAGGNGGRICVMATIDNCSNGQQCGGGKQGQQRGLQVLRVPSKGSSRRRVGRLQGGSCSNNNGSNVVALAAARLGGGLCKESMRVRAGDGGQRKTQQERAVDHAGQAGGRETTWQEGGRGQRKTSGWRTTVRKDRGRGHNTRWQWWPRYSAAALSCVGGAILAAAGCCVGGATGHGHHIVLWQIDCSLSLVVEQAAHGTQSHMKNPFSCYFSLPE